MLRSLRVRSFALIDHIEMDFDSGLNLLSGETGAGKSLIVDALSLLSGSKASTDWIRTGESRAVVEGIVDLDAAHFLEAAGLDPAEDGQVIIRREIAPDGRNRVFINNQPATVTILRQLAGQWIEIHGQNEHQSLLEPQNQLNLVDTCAGTAGLAASVRAAFEAVQRTAAELEALESSEQRSRERRDMLAFQREELERLAPQPGEVADLEQRISILAHGGKLLDAATRGHEALHESEHSVVSRLAQIERWLRDAASHDPELEPLVEQIQSIRVASEDVARQLRTYSGRLDLDPRELDVLQTRLADLQRHQRKYGPDLAGHLQKVLHELDSIGLNAPLQARLRLQLDGERARFGALADELRRRRHGSSPSLEAAVSREMQVLALPQARFAVQWSETTDRPTGRDSCQFLFTANPGEEPQALGRVASGGELSRVMLAIRTVMAETPSNRTLVFDEVDAGIGGKVAETVGSRLRELGRHYQVLCVSHLAQVAAFATSQFHIDKRVDHGRSVTRVQRIEGQRRIDELARMMGGTVTEAARRHVAELLERSQTA